MEKEYQITGIIYTVNLHLPLPRCLQAPAYGSTAIPVNPVQSLALLQIFESCRSSPGEVSQRGKRIQSPPHRMNPRGPQSSGGGRQTSCHGAGWGAPSWRIDHETINLLKLLGIKGREQSHYLALSKANVYSVKEKEKGTSICWVPNTRQRIYPCYLC